MPVDSVPNMKTKYPKSIAGTVISFSWKVLISVLVGWERWLAIPVMKSVSGKFQLCKQNSAGTTIRADAISIYGNHRMVFRMAEERRS